MPQFKGQYAVCDKIVKFTQIYVDRIFGACIKFFQFVATFSDSSHRVTFYAKFILKPCKIFRITIF